MTIVDQSIGKVFLTKEPTTSFTLIFEDFFQLTAATGKKSISSPKLPDSAGRKWGLNVYPDGAGELGVGWVSVFVVCDHGVTVASCTVSALNAAEPIRKSDAMVKVDSNGFGWQQFMSRESCLAEHCTINGTVAFQLDITALGHLETNTFGERAARIALPPPRVAEHVGTLCVNPVYADVVLVVQGERLPAHKCIICPRSPVFKAMFQHPMQEASTNEVAMSAEFSAAAVRAMLQFLYTDAIPIQDFHEVAVCELLALADFYQLPELQNYAEAHTVVTLDNIKALLQAAPLVGSQEMLDRVLQFAVIHAHELVELAEFVDLGVDVWRMLAGAFVGVFPNKEDIVEDSEDGEDGEKENGW